MQNLPINEKLAAIQQALNSHNRVVLQAPPGAGKTTAVPIALLGQPWLHDKQIIMLEPRRLAARNAAARMAYLLNEKLGQTVGYQIRQDSCYTDATRILVVTEGILTRKLQADPELHKTALVIFDEFHERSLHADLSLALCLQSQQILREDLKILVMSATLNTNAIAELLAATDHKPVPIIESEGRSFPVKIHYLDKPIKHHNRLQLNAILLNTVKHVIHHQQNHCLVFLPGIREIRTLTSQLKQYLQSEQISNIHIAPLHGSLNRQQQDQAIRTPADGLRKIVLATNIAETSITIEGINCVIDSGLERILEYSHGSALDRLKTQYISQDSADQRSGRAGRLSAGDCYRLWTVQQQQRLRKHSLPEILHSDLSALMLELASWGVHNTDELHWLDMPPGNACKRATALLQQLGALDENNRTTDHGLHMLSLGSHPRLAHMMLSAVKLGQAYHACLIAGILSEKDLYQANTEKTYDIHDRIKLLQQIQAETGYRQQGIDIQHGKKIIDTANDFFRRLKQCTNIGSKHTELDHNFSGVLLAFAYPDRIARLRRENEARYLLSNGKGAVIPAFLQQHLPEYLVIANLDAKQGEASIYLAAEISASQLEEFFKPQIKHSEIISWNEDLQRVEAKKTSLLGEIILQETPSTAKDKAAVQLCLLQAIQDKGLQCLNWTAQAINLKQRVQFIHYYLGHTAALKKLLKNNHLPDFSEQALQNSLPEWLLPQLTNENSIKQCQKLDTYSLLLNQLDWQQQQLLNQLAPEKITVPSSSAIRIDYSDPAQPVLAVRLQEVFGLYETPTLLNGHCKLMMHLLSPAARPMQVTQDLNSFWQTTYHEVKKELRGKYKKHYWPDDPFTAQATSKTKKQMNR